jgi:hypothetical protein
MNKKSFIQPRFVGARFESHTLPLSAGKDLAFYEDLVVELAKALYLKKYPSRTRAPKGFAKDFKLHLERIDDGCARPHIVAMTDDDTPIPPEFEEARRLVNEVMASKSNSDLPEQFPKSLLRYFNQIGYSLQSDESIEWTPESSDEKSVLDVAKRKRLALGVLDTYEKKVSIVGQIEVLDAKKKTGTLRSIEKVGLAFEYSESVFNELKRALGNKTEWVQMSGIGEFGANDELRSIVKVEDIDLTRHYPLVSRIEKLGELKAGWLDGHGVELKSEDLVWLSGETEKNFPENFVYPSVVPTEDGNVIFEWIHPQARIELEINFESSLLELYATDLKQAAFVEKVFQFSEWPVAYSNINALLNA